jgi:hypothetical protein
MVPDTHLRVLRRIYDALQDSGVTWVLTGSMGLALRGVPLTPGDIDIQTDEAGAYEIERRLAGFVTRPVAYGAAPHIRSHYGKLEIDGVQVEIMGDIQHHLDQDEWSPTADLRALIEHVAVTYGTQEVMQVPVLPLDYEHRAYVELGRTAKAELIERRLNEQNPTI